ncbi:hypothetical protein LC613_38800 [Nostoc sphaeroides CHAB 2801]|uniref:hypothetical protein n=1 Tax=Nostoc sphaeroides TaxID=446679 RepID=UPI001E63EA36|nr:hypothetical protein [Nostoc sphaeroides]MCC5633419.1 hypothetical protein [Nostoc sphaeroides CHAB 2801]
MLWELWAQSKRSRSKKRILTWSDRLGLRILVINFVAIAALLAWQRHTQFWLSKPKSFSCAIAFMGHSHCLRAMDSHSRAIAESAADVGDWSDGVGC